QAGDFMRTGVRGSPSWPGRTLMGRIHCSRLLATNWHQSACRPGAGHTFGRHKYWLMGFALYAARRYEEAVGTLKHELCRGTGSQRILAAALAQLGKLDEARGVARLFMISQPKFTVSGWAKTQAFRDPRDLQHF